MSKKKVSKKSRNDPSPAKPGLKGRLMAAAIAVLVVIIVILVLRPGQQSEVTEQSVQQSMDQSADQSADQTVEQTQEPVAEESDTAQNIQQQPAQAAAPSTRQTYNDVVLSEELAFPAFPVVKEAELESSMKYSVSFETDEPIHFFVYSEEMYNYWRETGYHGHSKANTVTADGCCAKIGSYSFDVNEGEGGKYYFIFDDSKLGTYDERPSQGHIDVVKTTNI